MSDVEPTGVARATRTPAIEELLGMPTGVLRDWPLDRAVDTIARSGFAVCEITPVAYGGAVKFDAAARTALKQNLSRFRTITVHVQAAAYLHGKRVCRWSPDVQRDDTTSLDPALRRRSVDDQLSHIDFAVDIGATVVTFHPGLGDPQASVTQKREAWRAFAEATVARAEGTGIRLGYEVSPTFFDLELIESVGSPSFGLLFDIGHAAKRCDGDLTAGVQDMIDECAERTVQFHLHGVHLTDEGEKKDHHPLHLNNGLDFRRILETIEARAPDAPIVLEIVKYPGCSAEANLQNALSARDELIRIRQSC